MCNNQLKLKLHENIHYTVCLLHFEDIDLARCAFLIDPSLCAEYSFHEIVKNSSSVCKQSRESLEVSHISSVWRGGMLSQRWS